MERKESTFIISLLSVACIGLMIGGVVLGWEFWVPPLIAIGMVAMWVMHIRKQPQATIRENYYIVFAMLAAFWHGVHGSSFFDVAVVFAFVMVIFSLLSRTYMMRALFAEYLIVLFIQIWLAGSGHTMAFGFLEISRIFLHVLVVFSIYGCCMRSIENRNESQEIIDALNRHLDVNNNDMDDFLSNISHELRTPINVVSGMSDLIIRKNSIEEALAIKEAGIRLTEQIGDIQDYTETQRESMLLEEEDYMCTSLVNDVISGFIKNAQDSDLETVVDMSVDIPAVMRGDVKKLRKILRHLLENALKFTKTGGVLLKIYTEPTGYGVNLCIEVIDTGIGMSSRDTSNAFKGMYQVNKKRDRSSGGVGLCLSIVYGFAHKMGGCVRIISEKGEGTTVRVTIPQKVVDAEASLKLDDSFDGALLMFAKLDKFNSVAVRGFYRSTALNLVSELHLPLYSADNMTDLQLILERQRITHIILGIDEYEAERSYFDALISEGVVVAPLIPYGRRLPGGSRAVSVPKPLWAYSVIRVLNGEGDDMGVLADDHNLRPNLSGIKALIVDDEPMNLVVASGLFGDYGMVIDTASGGKEAIVKYRAGDYDIVFMDHMMPEMDGVETMKRIREIAVETDRKAVVVALTANVVSGAREMFMREGFDGFIAKPVNLDHFEKVMMRVLPETVKSVERVPEIRRGGVR